MGWIRRHTRHSNLNSLIKFVFLGAADRVIKIWDLASGKLKVSLTGHVSTVRGKLIGYIHHQVSPRHPYLFSCGEDRQVKCWDLEYNKVIRHYHGHLSAVYTIKLHPGIDVLVTAGRDATARVWDMRTKANVHTLSGHTDTVASLACQAAEPQVIFTTLHYTSTCCDRRARRDRARVGHAHQGQRAHAVRTHGHGRLARLPSRRASEVGARHRRAPLALHVRERLARQHQAVEVPRGQVYTGDTRLIITGSRDSTVRLWDLAAGKSLCTLTNHKKSVRAIAVHPSLYTFASASPDNIKQWKCPEGKFIQNLSGHNAIVNCMAVNPEGVLVSGGDNGTMHLWDWRTGHNFQRLQ
ncbi:Uncharacterized protein OBRU01_26299, partial [Operophtera brumata]